MSRPPLSGHTVHGVSIGILMLNTSFQRLPGDVGNALTWDFPVAYRIIETATQDRVFSGGTDGLIDAFAAGCADLAASGVRGIATSCGFLAPMQAELSARSPIPVVTSSLLQVPMVQALIGARRRVGVITIDAASLTDAHFPVGTTLADIDIAGMPVDGVLRSDLRGNAKVVDAKAQSDELCAVGRAMVERQPDLGAFVIECTNLAPHSRALQAATGLPVFDVVTLVNWFHAALQARAWPAA